MTACLTHACLLLLHHLTSAYTMPHYSPPRLPCTNYHCLPLLLPLPPPPLTSHPAFRLLSVTSCLLSHCQGLEEEEEDRDDSLWGGTLVWTVVPGGREEVISERRKICSATIPAATNTLHCHLPATGTNFILYILQACSACHTSLLLLPHRTLPPLAPPPYTPDLPHAWVCRAAPWNICIIYFLLCFCPGAFPLSKPAVYTPGGISYLPLPLYSAFTCLLPAASTIYIRIPPAYFGTCCPLLSARSLPTPLLPLLPL